MRRNTTLESFVGPWEKLARIMSRDYGVEVRAEGFRPGYDGKVIRLPSVIGDTKDGDDGWYEIIRGVCDHEIGHAIEENRERERGRSTFDFVRKCRSQRERGLLNSIEDIRSERATAKDYPGAGDNLRHIQEWAGEYTKARGERGELTRDPWHTLSAAIYLKAQGQPIDWLPSEFGELIEKIDPEIEASKNLADIEESFGLMKEILRKLADLRDELDKEREEAAGGESDDEEEGESSESGSESFEDSSEGTEDDTPEEEGQDGDQGGDKADQPGGDEEGGEGSDENSEGDPGASGEESDESGSEDTSPTGSDPSPSEEGESSSKGDYDGESATSDEPPPGMSPEKREKVLDLIDSLEHTEPDSTDVFEELKGEIEEKAKTEAKVHGKYVPDPKVKAQDTFEKVTRGSAAEYRRQKARVRKQISGLKSKLIQLLRARSQGRIVRDQERGQLDTAVLYSLKTGNKRVFTQEIKGEVVDTAVAILVDQSGSMEYGGKVSATQQTAIALAESLDALGIPFEILGFSNRGYSRHEDPAYDRWMPLQMDIFKSFDEPYKRVKNRLTGIQGSGENTDGEAVWYAAERLARRPEARKILFVLSDGNPCGGGRNLADHLTEVVTKITSVGIEVFGIGILTSAVKMFYNEDTGAESIVIEDINQLAKATFTVLRDKLLRRVS